MGKRILFELGKKVPNTHWTVLREAESRNGERMYECCCDCGTIRNVSAKSLKYGKSLSCGCIKPQDNKGWFPEKEKNNLELTGKVFGSVKVLERVSGHGTTTIWECECMACGKIFQVVQYSLTSGRTNSCGCVHYKKSSEKCKEYMGIIDGTNVSRISSKKISSANTTGVRGVSYKKKLGKYNAYIGFKGKLYNLGYYERLEEAKAVRKEAEEAVYGSFLEDYYENLKRKTTRENKRIESPEPLARHYTKENDRHFVDRVYLICKKIQCGEKIAVHSSDYQFIAQQKHDYTNLPKWRRDLLDSTGILEVIGKRPTYLWEEKFDSAKKYYNKFGNLMVPVTYVTEDGFPLGRWLANLRNIYRGNAKGILEKEEIRRLESIGMVWDIKDRLTWEEWYNLAKEYYNEHGNLEIPSGYETNGHKLGKWIINQRTARNRLESGRKITQDQIKRLDQIGMCWMTRKTSKKGNEL